MRKFHIPIFSGYLTSGGVNETFSDHDLNALLGSVEQLSISGYAEPAAGTSPTLNFEILQSSDGITWTGRSTSTADFSLSTSAETLFQFADLASDTNGRVEFVRIKMWVGGTGPKATVYVWATGHEP